MTNHSGGGTLNLQEHIKQAEARCDWLDSLGYQNCASDVRRVLQWYAVELSAAQSALAEKGREVESLREREGVIEECCQAAALSVNEIDYIERHQVEKTIRAIRTLSAAPPAGEGKEKVKDPHS
jgi:hypothetical protein